MSLGTCASIEQAGGVVHSEKRDLNVPTYSLGVLFSNPFLVQWSTERIHIRLCHWLAHISFPLSSHFPILGVGATNSFLKFKILNKVYETNGSQILPRPSDSQPQMIFKFILSCFTLWIFPNLDTRFWLNPKGTDNWHHSGLIRLCASLPWPQGFYSDPQNVFIRPLNCSEASLEKQGFRDQRCLLKCRFLKHEHISLLQDFLELSMCKQACESLIQGGGTERHIPPPWWWCPFHFW